MGLQLRVRHSMGARIVEVHDGGPNRPVRIGRDPSAAVQVPSGVVLPVHCLLYQRKGRWIIEKAEESADISVNGEPIGQTAALEFGDSITLGSGAGAAVLELDPLGTARRAVGAAGGVARPAAPDRESSINTAPAPARKPSPPPQPVAAAAAAAHDDAGEFDAASNADDDEQWDLNAGSTASTAAGGWPASPQPASYRRPPRVKESGQGTVVMICVAFGVTILILGGLIVNQINKRNERAKIIVPPPEVKLPEVQGSTIDNKQHGSIFDNFGEKPVKVTTPPKGTVYSPTFGGKNNVPPKPAPPAGDVPANPAGGDDGVPAASRAQLPDDPAADSPEWRNIQDAFNSLDSVRAIWACHDFMTAHPGKLQADVQARLAEALDLLWWQRINQLCTQRDDLKGTIARVTREISEEAPASAFKQKLEKDKAAEEYRFSKTIETLADDMGYRSNVIPNPLNSAELDVLRKDRDPEKYDAWCKKVSQSIRRTRKAPWG